MSRILQKIFKMLRYILSTGVYQSRLAIIAYRWIYGLLLRADWRKISKSSEKCTIILMNYKRPFNMECQLRLVLSCDFVGEVLLSNNNPECDLNKYITTCDPRLKIINQTKQRFASVRFELARVANFQWIIAIDDDVFPTPKQLQNLFHNLLSDPSCPHGWAGERYRTNLTEPDDSSQGPIYELFVRKDMEVDTLIWAFAFTKKINESYFQLLSKIEETNDSITSSEDVVLSYSGDKSSRIHSSSGLINCPTANNANIATWRQSGFIRRRMQLVDRCRRVTGISISVAVGDKRYDK
jgi:hypothetical protein